MDHSDLIVWSFIESSIGLKRARVEDYSKTGLEVIQPLYMLNSNEHEIYPAHKC